MVAELKALYQAGNFDQIMAGVEACLSKYAEENFVTTQEKSDVVHDPWRFWPSRCWR
jgi:hypothetical protein